MDLFANLPVYTAITTAVLTILQLFLMGRVIAQRGKTEVLIGDGGIEIMQQTIRVHGNLVENAPIFLIGLALAELIAGSTWVVLALGVVFALSRILHAVGYSKVAGVSSGRLIGTLGTMITTLAVAIYLVWVSLGHL